MKRVLTKSVLLLLTLALILTTAISPAFAAEVSDPAEARVSDVVVRPLPEDYRPSETAESNAAVTTTSVYNAIIALKKKYPEGTTWNDSNVHTWYVWDTNYIVDLYACYGWAAMCSDVAFGDVNGDYPIRKYFVKSGADTDLCDWCRNGNGSFTYDSLRPGDILRINNNGHSVVVLEKYDDHIVICEGNYGGIVHWGREMSKSQVLKADYVITRYPEPPEEAEAVSANGHVQVSWDAVPGATKYKVWRKESGGSWKSLKTTENAFFQDDSAKMGTSSYRVQAYIPGMSWSHYSDSDSVKFNPFTDLPDDASYFKAVQWAYNNKIVTGTTATTFSPAANCTRAQFVLMMWKMYGSPVVSGPNPFTDIEDGTKVAKAVLWAYKMGYVNGTTATTFSPRDPITRGQMIMIFWKIAGRPVVSGMTSPFTDVPSDLIPKGGKLYNALMWAASIKLTTVSGEPFRSRDFCTRAQLTIFLYRFNNKVAHLI